MKLQQNQIWKKGDDYYRIVELERLAVKYKEMQDPELRDGEMHDVTKKEFCRLIKGAELLPEGMFKVELLPEEDDEFFEEEE